MSPSTNGVNGVNGTATQSPAPSSPAGLFSLANKVILVSGAGRGLGLTQTEALLEAGAIVYALDRLRTNPLHTPSPLHTPLPN